MVEHVPLSCAVSRIMITVSTHVDIGHHKGCALHGLVRTWPVYFDAAWPDLVLKVFVAARDARGSCYPMGS